MRAWQVYYKGNIVDLDGWIAPRSVSESILVQRVCCITDELLMLLTDDGCLYAAQFEKNSNLLKFQLQCERIHDVDYCASLKQLFVVTDKGTVLTQALKSESKIGDGLDITGNIFDNWRTLSFDPLELSEDGIHVKRVCCSAFGTIFLTYSHGLYAIGDCGDIFSVDVSQPKHIRIFDEPSINEVVDIVAGNEFFALLLRMSYDEKLDPLHLKINSRKKAQPPTRNVVATPSTPSLKWSTPPPALLLTSSSKFNGNSKNHLAPNDITHQDLNSNSSLHSLSDSSTKSSQGSDEVEEDYNVSYHLIMYGYSLLHTQVHIFRSANNGGLLRTGDHIKCVCVNHIKKLDNIGACSIAAGREHGVIRTLDGRVLHCGFNSKQKHLESQFEEHIDLSSQLECTGGGKINNQRSVIAACCGADIQTVLLNGYGELYANNIKVELEKSLVDDQSDQSNNKDLSALDICDNLSKKEHPPHQMLLAAGDFIIHNKRKFRHQFLNVLVTLRTNLKKLLNSMPVIEMLQSFQQKNKNNEREEQLQPLRQLQLICINYRKIVCLIAAAVKSLELFFCGDIESAADILFIKHHREFIALFEAYTRTNCDNYSHDGYSEASKILANMHSMHSTTTTTTTTGKSGTKSTKNTSEQKVDEMIDLSKVFQQPIHVVSGILQFLEQLSKMQSQYVEHLLAWQAYARQNAISQEIAENTFEFWKENSRNVKICQFRRRHRRVILTSTSVPLKLSHHGISISTPIFILFSDCLCQFGSQLFTFPLATMWITNESDTSFRVTTPEKSFILMARNQHDKRVWYDQLELAILAALRRPQGSKLSSLRTTTYVFSNSHPKYAGVHAYGRWRNALLHGTCYLEYPDGRFYYGEMRNGEIDGYGKMVIPSVGLYEGFFKAGKFHGHGTYEMKDEIYDGNFRDGLFHGHGQVRNKNYTYVGEYQANAKCGYGVLDDMISGDKYMGMFADNKRVGAGTCITMTGDYFEGIFANDELAGNGIAYFENEFYYEGELNMSGPCGKGTYYMPCGVVSDNEVFGINDEDEVSNRVLMGNILRGQLNGNWQNVRIVSGNLSINQHFSKYPKSIGDLVVDNNRKWRSLFENFEEEIFGNSSNNMNSPRTASETETSNAAANSARMHWNRIAVFMTTYREQEKALEQDSMSVDRGLNYFGQNISMGFGCKSFDGSSLKSTNIFLGGGDPTINDLKSISNRHTTKRNASPPVRSHSQETLYDSSLDLNELNYLQRPSNDDIQSISEPLPNWSINTLNGVCIVHNSGGGFVQNNMGNAASSLRSSYDSIFNLNSSFNNNSFTSMLSSQNMLEYVPSFGIVSLNEDDITAIKDYLTQAFKDRHHPLYLLNQRIANCFYISYGCWKVKPSAILAKQAIREWECMSSQIYRFIRKMFPALPEDYCVIENTREVISHITLLYPIILTEGIYSTLFVLYANRYSRKDELYRQNLINAEKLSDSDLALNVGLECTLIEIVRTSLFTDAIQTLKKLQEKHSPKAMLGIIELCMQQITDAHKMIENTNNIVLAADSMMPLTLFMVLRAAVPHLGAELALLGDLTGGANFKFEMNGIAGYCYTTLKAAYEHITAKPLTNRTT